MKFLRSEGRVIALVEKEDADGVPPAQIPHIDLLLIARHHEDHVRNSHIWIPLIQAVGSKMERIIYW